MRSICEMQFSSSVTSQAFDNGAGECRVLGNKYSSKVMKLGGLEIDSRLLASLVGRKFVGHPLVINQRAQASLFDRRYMNKRVRTAIFRRDESISLVGAEEFDFADRHGLFL